MQSRMIRARSSLVAVRGHVRKLSLESLEERSLLAGIDLMQIASALADDAYEDNDTRLTARNLGTLSSSHTINNLVQADANDWYRFNTTRAGSAATNVSISFLHAQGDLDLELYNGAGTRLRVSQGIGNSETVSLASLAAGTYYVRIFGYRGVANPNYSLGINLGSSVLVDDAYENNDTLAAATNLGTLTTNATLNNLSLADSADWFRFTTTATGTTASVVSLGFQNTQGNLALQLYNSTGSLIATANGSGNAESLSLAGRAAGTYYARVYSASGATNPNYSLQIVAPVTTTSTTPPSTSTGGFDIQIVYSGFTASQRAIFERAAARWESIIVGDLPNATYNGVVVDDLLINASSSAIDGVGGTLGQAGYDRARTTGTRLPFHGMMEFDSADLASMEASGTLYNVILHEIAHVFGLGTLWQARGLVTGAGTSNPQYIGTQGLAAYRSIFGTNATGVPLENGGGAGTRDAHWRETTFNNEIMTGYINSGSNPISRITVGSLADLGYTVNMAAADAYSRPASSTTTARTTTSATSNGANLLSAAEMALNVGNASTTAGGFVPCLCRSCTGAVSAPTRAPVEVNVQADPLLSLWQADNQRRQVLQSETASPDENRGTVRNELAGALELLFAGERDWSCIAPE